MRRTLSVIITDARWNNTTCTKKSKFPSVLYYYYYYYYYYYLLVLPTATTTTTSEQHVGLPQQLTFSFT